MKYVLTLVCLVLIIITCGAHSLEEAKTNTNILDNQYKLNKNVPDSVVINLFVSVADHASIKLRAGIHGNNFVCESGAENYAFPYGKTISNSETMFILNTLGHIFLNGKDKRYIWQKKQKMWVEGDYPFLSIDMYKNGHKRTITEFLSERQGDLLIKYSDDFMLLQRYLMSKSREIYSLKYSQQDKFSVIVKYSNDDEVRICLSENGNYFTLNNSSKKFYISKSISEELIRDIRDIESKNVSELIGIELFRSEICNIESIHVRYGYRGCQNSLDYKFIYKEDGFYPYGVYTLLSDINRKLIPESYKYINECDK